MDFEKLNQIAMQKKEQEAAEWEMNRKKEQLVTEQRIRMLRNILIPYIDGAAFEAAHGKRGQREVVLDDDFVVRNYGGFGYHEIFLLKKDAEAITKEFKEKLSAFSVSFVGGKKNVGVIFSKEKAYVSIDICRW